MLSSLNSGLNGLQINFRGMQKDAHNIAQQNKSGQPADRLELPSSMVNLKTHALHAKAAVKVLQLSSDVMKSIVDIKV